MLWRSNVFILSVVTLSFSWKEISRNFFCRIWIKNCDCDLPSLLRSKRKVLGRKEPSDSFGSRQSLVSPVKHSTSGSDLRTLTLGSSQRSSSRNENFMALLQKKGSKSSSGGARVSAMELLKSTNPLARRVTEFSATPSSTSEGADAAGGKADDQWKKPLSMSLDQAFLPLTKLPSDSTQYFHSRWGPVTNASNWIAPTIDWPFVLSNQIAACFGQNGLPMVEAPFFAAKPEKENSMESLFDGKVLWICFTITLRFLYREWSRRGWWWNGNVAVDEKRYRSSSCLVYV